MDLKVKELLCLWVFDPVNSLVFIYIRKQIITSVIDNRLFLL